MGDKGGVATCHAQAFSRGRCEVQGDATHVRNAEGQRVVGDPEAGMTECARTFPVAQNFKITVAGQAEADARMRGGAQCGDAERDRALFVLQPAHGCAERLSQHAAVRCVWVQCDAEVEVARVSQAGKPDRCSGTQRRRGKGGESGPGQYAGCGRDHRQDQISRHVISIIAGASFGNSALWG